MPKMHQNTFGGPALSGPARELKRCPGPPSCNRVVLLLREEGEEKIGDGKGQIGKGRGGQREGREEKECAP